MKKIIALSALAIIATNTAEASKARLLALGENLETAGSLYFSDNRNIFQNAAFIHEYKDAIYMEWGAQGTEFNSNYTVPGANNNLANKLDSDTNPQAEGGFLKSHGKYVYGVYVGAESYITHEARNYLRLTNSANIHQDNQIDLFFGAAESADFKWGANVTYSNTEDDASRSKQKSASIRLGAMGTKWEGYANVAVMNEAETAAITVDPTGLPTSVSFPAIAGKDKFEGKGGWELGGSYDLGFAKAFGYWRHGAWEQDVTSAIGIPTPPVPTGAVYQGKTEFDTNRVRAGLGRELELNERTTLFTKLEYVMTKREVKGKGTPAGKANIDDYYVPLTIGLEHDATSWLTLRGSVTQYLVSEQDVNYRQLAPAVSPLVKAKYAQGKRSFANSTNVNTGLTLKFGDLSIDGMIGTSTDGEVGDTKSEKGVLSLDNLASRVAMTYKF